ncbi:predicted protein [Arabidopsis lyrata subsp. lyrata]|uniref:Predicted protein n=1 Tax=Arabidopsis lyrata subsp. lyrata TaxID=81972 RepID=D7L039_ARALL|nr:predicted protein [Arabidopsis lyrata subsp. lyrata]
MKRQVLVDKAGRKRSGRSYGERNLEERWRLGFGGREKENRMVLDVCDSSCSLHTCSWLRTVQEVEQEMNKKINEIVEQELKFAKENMKKSQSEEAMSEESQSEESLTVSVGEEEASVGVEKILC